MSFYLSIGLAACFFLVLLYQYVLYPLFISPLSKIPSAHPTAALSSFWIEHKRRIGHEIRSVYAAHRRLGPVVRLGPSEVSFASLDGLRKIYIGGLEKHSWYTEEFTNYGRPNLVSMLRSKEHSERKRMVSRVYSKSYLLSSNDMIACCGAIVFDRLLPVLLKAAAEADPINIHTLNAAANLDLNSTYLLGLQNGTNFICNEEALTRYLRLNNSRLRHLRDEIQASKEMEDMYMRMSEAAERDLETASYEGIASDAKLGKTRPVVFAALLQGLEKAGVPYAERMLQTASEMLDNVVAGHETGATTLTYLMYELSRNPTLQERLRAELRTLNPPIRPGGGGVLPALEALDGLPLLAAVLQETLRLYAPSPAPQPRITSSAGLMIDGYGPFPAGVRVSVSAFVVHRDPEAWPNPLVWQPERWLPGGHGATADMRKWFWAFSSGGRMCIGSNFALLTLKLLIAAVYTNFTTTIIDDRDVQQRDFHLTAPVGEKLILQFHRVSEL